MKMAKDTSSYGWSNVNSHLIKNSEWGAVAYLSYSKYGRVPMDNNCGSIVSGSHYYDMMTGAGPASSTTESRYNYDASTFETTHSYSSDNGKLASTTGNIYGCLLYTSNLLTKNFYKSTQKIFYLFVVEHLKD